MKLKKELHIAKLIIDPKGWGIKSNVYENSKKITPLKLEVEGCENTWGSKGTLNFTYDEITEEYKLKPDIYWPDKNLILTLESKEAKIKGEFDYGYSPPVIEDYELERLDKNDLKIQVIKKTEKKILCGDYMDLISIDPTEILRYYAELYSHSHRLELRLTKEEYEEMLTFKTNTVLKLTDLNIVDRYKK